MSALYRVVGHSFVAGVVVEDDRVVVTAPYLKRYRGRRWSAVLAELERQGCRVQRISAVES